MNDNINVYKPNEQTPLDIQSFKKIFNKINRNVEMLKKD